MKIEKKSEQQDQLQLDKRSKQAVDELQSIISQHYPTASFSVSRGIDDPEGIDLRATVDVDDPDEVLDRVIDRVVELHVDEGIPIHVIPLRTPARIAAAKAQAAKAKRGLRPHLFGKLGLLDSGSALPKAE